MKQKVSDNYVSEESAFSKVQAYNSLAPIENIVNRPNNFQIEKSTVNSDFTSIETCLEIPAVRPPLKTTTGQFWVSCSVFLLLGMTNFYGYSMMLNSGKAIQRYLYPKQNSMADTVLAVFMTFDFLVTAILSFYGSVNLTFVLLGLAMMAFGSVGVLLVCQFVEGLVGSIFIHLLCAIIGIGSSISCSATFTFAAELRNPTFAATVSTGGGLSGVVSFGAWMLLIQTVFDYNYNGVRKAIWILLGVGSVLPLVTFVIYFYFIRTSWIHQYLSGCPPPEVQSVQVPVTRSAMNADSATFAELELFTSKPAATRSSGESSRVFKTKSASQALVEHSVDENRTSSESKQFDVSEMQEHTDVVQRYRESAETLQSNGNKNTALSTTPVAEGLPPASLHVDGEFFQNTQLPASIHNSGDMNFRKRRREWLRVLKACYPAVSLGFLATFVSYLLFPAVGPHHWAISKTREDIIVGIFQIGDMMGRYTPILATCFPFFYPRRLPHNDIFGSYWWQTSITFFSALTMGWASTITMIYASLYLNDNDQIGRSKANSLGVFGILLGISGGQWASNLLVL